MHKDTIFGPDGSLGCKGYLWQYFDLMDFFFEIDSGDMICPRKNIIRFDQRFETIHSIV